jgi:branched-chain amino acid transport system ATP-binding protein
MTALKLDSISRTFGGVRAVQDVSFALEPGRVTGLIGPNGAGKTTVVNLITGLLALTSGRVLLGDEDLSTAPPDVIGRAGVARTFQNIRLLPETSVAENVMIGFHRLEKSSALACRLGTPFARRETAHFREQADELLVRFGMKRYENVMAGALSYGHQRRVEIMRALAPSPVVLLLDEPVAGMNDVESDELGHLITALAETGMAVMLIEHNMQFVMRLCKHICVLDGGKLIAEGDGEGIASNPTVITAYLGT